MSIFYVKNGGSDAASGLSDALAWETLAKVHDYGTSPGFAAGDSILLRRGDTWREYAGQFYGEGTAGNPITYGAYGTGAKPIISGGIDRSATGDWADQGGNRWRTSTLPLDIAGIMFNSEASIGLKKANWAACSAQGHFYKDYVGQYVDLYSVGNPGTYYSKVELVQRQEGMQLISQSYVTIRNITFQYCGWHALPVTGCDHVIVEYCDFRWAGGGYTTPGSDTVRDGNGIFLWDGGSDITIRYNTFEDVWETAISFQTMSAVSMERVYIYGNTFIRTHSALDWWLYHASATGDSMLFCHNVCYQQGGSAYEDQRPYPYYGAAVRIYGFEGGSTNMKVKNNIFHTCNNAYIHVDQDESEPPVTADITNWDIDYNCYYPQTANYGNVFRYGAEGWVPWATWLSLSGKDAHSITADPLFVSVP